MDKLQFLVLIIIIIINGEAPIVRATARRPSRAMVSAMRPDFSVVQTEISSLQFSLEEQEIQIPTRQQNV